jgi:uncharacterized membrane protein YidH (DUF202 family)
MNVLSIVIGLLIAGMGLLANSYPELVSGFHVFNRKQANKLVSKAFPKTICWTMFSIGLLVSILNTYLLIVYGIL